MKIGPLEITLKLRPPATAVSPMREAGTSGTSVYSGYVQERERDSALIGRNRYETFSDILVNTSVVAAGLRYFVNLVAKSAWKVIPVADNVEAKKYAEFVESVIKGLDTPWTRIVRRATSFRFYGFGVHEWTGLKRKDGQIGFASLNVRPQHSIEQWDVTSQGKVNGFFQNANDLGVNTATVYIPRAKTVYLVDDSLTDSPEGMGVLRHLVEPVRRLNKYLQLEGRGYERDLNGIPVGKVPYAALNKAVAAGVFKKEEAEGFIASLENFVKLEATGKATGLLLDSQPFESIGENGRSVSSIAQWGIELLKGGSVAHQPMASAILRTNQEIARILGTEGLMLGGDGAGSLALSKDKSAALLLQANSTLTDLREGISRDFIDALWMLNGFPDDMKPIMGTEEIQQKDATAIAIALKNMADAGATMTPDDPAVNDVRDILGVESIPKELAARQVEDKKEADKKPVVAPPTQEAPDGGTAA